MFDALEMSENGFVFKLFMEGTDLLTAGNRQNFWVVLFNLKV
jgi:hypothetical protein